jgi:pantetheine-phosphate adenylyltransferase
MIALYPGSFDPITYGHVDVATRAAQMFDTLVIAPVQTNSKSSKLFSTEERIAMIEESLAEVPNIRVQSFTGLTVDFARSIGAGVLIRGLRLVTDFEYELQLAQNNAVLNPAVETCCIITSHQVGFISSSQVKEIALNGGDVSRLVPPPVLGRLNELYRLRSN